jgi:type IV secretory pathway TrbF-like protein
MGMDLWQTAATYWITTYNELVKKASKMSEYWFNLFNPWSKVNERQDKVKVE